MKQVISRKRTEPKQHLSLKLQKDHIVVNKFFRKKVWNLQYSVIWRWIFGVSETRITIESAIYVCGLVNKVHLVILSFAKLNNFFCFENSKNC